MDRTVLYIQPSEEAVGMVREQLKDEDAEFLAAPSASDAFDIMNSQEISVVLFDCHIPDMKMLDFIKTCVRTYPDTMLNICIDKADPKLISTIANMKQVKKLYQEPWDIEEMAEGVIATLDRMCIDRDFKRRQELLKEDQGEFEKTLDSLKNALLKQQYSYRKLERVLGPFLDSVLKLSGENDKTGFNNLAKYVCSKVLYIMTTAKIDVDSLPEYLSKDLSSALPKSGRIVLKNVESCIVGKTERDKLNQTVFCIWLEVLAQSYRMKSGEIEIDSYYLPSSAVRFEIAVSGEPAASCPERTGRYIDDIIRLNCQEYSRSDEDGKTVYSLDFILR